MIQPLKTGEKRGIDIFIWSFAGMIGVRLLCYAHITQHLHKNLRPSKMIVDILLNPYNIIAVVRRFRFRFCFGLWFVLS